MSFIKQNIDLEKLNALKRSLLSQDSDSEEESIEEVDASSESSDGENSFEEFKLDLPDVSSPDEKDIEQIDLCNAYFQFPWKNGNEVLKFDEHGFLVNENNFLPSVKCHETEILPVPKTEVFKGTSASYYSLRPRNSRRLSTKAIESSSSSQASTSKASELIVDVISLSKSDTDTDTDPDASPSSSQHNDDKVSGTPSCGWRTFGLIDHLYFHWVPSKKIFNETIQPPVSKEKSRKRTKRKVLFDEPRTSVSEETKRKRRKKIRKTEAEYSESRPVKIRWKNRLGGIRRSKYNDTNQSRKDTDTDPEKERIDSHNQLERARREELRLELKNLKKAVFHYSGDEMWNLERVSKISILRGATELIENINIKSMQQESIYREEKERNRKLKNILKKILKK